MITSQTSIKRHPLFITLITVILFGILKIIYVFTSQVIKTIKSFTIIDFKLNRKLPKT